MASLNDSEYSTYVNGIFTKIYTVDDICTSIRERIEDANRKAERAQEEMQKMKDEKWKDNELQSMKKRVETMAADYYRGFPISEKESDKISKWKDQHWTIQHQAPTNEKRLKKMGAIGGSFTYEFVPTSIGTIGTVCCTACKVKARNKAYEELYTIAKDNPKFRLSDRIRELEKEYDAEFDFQSL